MSPDEALQAVAALSARLLVLEAKVAELQQASGEKEAAETLSDDELRQGGLDSLIAPRYPDLGEF